MRKLMILSFFLVLWGGYKMPIEADDLLVKRLSRPDQMVEIGIFCFVLCVLFLIIVRRIILKRALLPRPLFRKYSVHIFILYFMALISSAVSYYPSYSFFRAGQYLIAIFLISYMLEEISDTKVIINCLYLFSIANICYLVFAYLYFPDVVMAGGRLVGGGFFKVDNGYVTFVVAILSFCYYLTERRRFLKMIHFGLFGLSINFLFLTEVRQLIYPMPFLLLFILFSFWKISFRSLCLISIAVFVVVILRQVQVFDYTQIVRERGLVSESRKETWIIILENISDIPYYGFGFLGTPPFLMPIKESLARKMILITADPHNYFLTALTEFGVMGFLYSIIIVLVLLNLLFRRWKESSQSPSVYLFPALFSIILQGIISAFFENFLISPIRFNTLSIITCILLLAKVTPEWERTTSLRTMKRIRVRW